MTDSHNPVAAEGNGGRGDPVVSVQDLVVRYGDHTVLNGVNLDVYAGETMVILGGSGSGKSTPVPPYRGPRETHPRAES